MTDEAQTDGDLLYVGTYTEGTRSKGIYLIRMDRRSGQLRKVGSIDAGPNPSFLTSTRIGAFSTPSTSSSGTRGDRLVR
jgi:6-phosphogluconolactonase